MACTMHRPVVMKPSLVVVGFAACLAAASCSSTPPGTNPHDMSVAQHRAHAHAEDDRAQAHEAQYDPAAEETEVTDTFNWDTRSYNPTKHHLDAANEHRTHASAHREAAEALEKYEEHECAEFPPTTRGACPLLDQVAAAENIDDGVRITVVDGVNRTAMAAHMRCHLAYAATRGYEGMESCPLYVKGVAIEESDSAITLKAGTPTGIEAVQQTTATHVK